jgi:hypothetical protein
MQASAYVGAGEAIDRHPLSARSGGAGPGLTSYGGAR